MKTEMPGREKRRTKRGQIAPESDDFSDTGETTDKDIKMEKIDDKKDKIRMKMKDAALRASLQKNAIQNIVSAKTSASKWKKYTTTKRKLIAHAEPGQIDRRQTGGIGLEYDLTDHSDPVKDKLDGIKGTRLQMIATHNRNLIEYFARLGKSTDAEVCVNLDYLESIIQAGADINCSDKYGQTIFHEVARGWHVDIAKFLVMKKANVNQADNYGRTPLHVAAAVDYPEMVNFLIESGADKDAKSKGECQTPVHFAARSDACQSLKALIKNGCEYKGVLDYKGRTPLHIAAELDRSETAKFLLELADPATAMVEDESGQTAITWMISKMPPVAKLALDQFHTTDRANRKQAFHMHRLEPRKPDDPRKGFPQSPMQVLVRFRRYDLIEHPAFLQLIKIKWEDYAMLRAVGNFFVNFFFVILWTLQGVLVEYDVRYRYDLPEQWWRIVLFVMALLLTAWQLKDELSEYINSKTIHNLWREWRDKELDRDLCFAHPRWPEEERYLLDEKKTLDEQRPQYLNDLWNIFDWVVYTLLLFCIITHLVDIGYHNNTISRLHIRVMAITIILIWVRLLKNLRAFSFLGPFIVMLSHMLSDVLRFVILYLEFFFPFACAFWMLFGGDKVLNEFSGRPDAQNYTTTVEGMQTVDQLLFSLFRMTLVDEYDYAGMRSIDPVMAYILVGMWLGLSAILMLNLFIALLSDTFQRIYDNAKANAVMQKAINIVGIEEGLSHKRREKFRKYIHESCAPLALDYDDDEVPPGGEDLQKVTIQIKEQLDEMEQKLMMGEYNLTGTAKKPGQQKPKWGGKSLDASISESVTGSVNQDYSSDVNALKQELQDIKENQMKLNNRLKRDMSFLKDVLMQIVGRQENVLPPGDYPEEQTSFTTGRLLSLAQPIQPPPPLYTTRPPMAPRPYYPGTEGRVGVLGVGNPNMGVYHSFPGVRPGPVITQQDDLQSQDGVLSGSQLVVEVSDLRIPDSASPPPYRSDADTQHSSNA